MAIFGEQSAMMAALESRAAVRRGTISGTAITPAARQPKNATMKSSPGGNRSTARSPLAVRCARRAATARARLMQLGESQMYVRAAAFGHEHEGLRVGPFGRTPGEQIDQ